jgi:hypothetical protein
MRTLVFVMYACMLAPTSGSAQGPRWFAMPASAPIGQEIVFTLQNRTTSTLYVRGSTPFMVQDSNQKIVFQPRGLPITTPIPPAQSLPFVWNQLDLQLRQVPAGLYEGVLDYATQPTGPLIRVKELVQVSDVVLAAGGTPTPGGRIVYTLSSPPAAALGYQVALSFADHPAIMIPGMRRIDLTPDVLFFASLTVPVNPFEKFRGTLDTNGKAIATLHLPQIPQLVGTRICAAFVTLASGSPGGVFNNSATTMVTVK